MNMIFLPYCFTCYICVMSSNFLSDFTRRLYIHVKIKFHAEYIFFYQLSLYNVPADRDRTSGMQET